MAEWPHHRQEETATNRPSYRNPREEKAVKVYTVNQESCYLLIFNVPALGVTKELLELFSLYGEIEEYRLLDEYPSEPYTDVYLIKYRDNESARQAKRKLDDHYFFSKTLHVCYGPEYESVQDVREKLQRRKEFILQRTKSRNRSLVIRSPPPYERPPPLLPLPSESRPLLQTPPTAPPPLIPSASITTPLLPSPTMPHLTTPPLTTPSLLPYPSAVPPLLPSPNVHVHRNNPPPLLATPLTTAPPLQSYNRPPGPNGGVHHSSTTPSHHSSLPTPPTNTHPYKRPAGRTLVHHPFDDVQYSVLTTRPAVLVSPPNRGERRGEGRVITDDYQHQPLTGHPSFDSTITSVRHKMSQVFYPTEIRPPILKKRKRI